MLSQCGPFISERGTADVELIPDTWNTSGTALDLVCWSETGLLPRRRSAVRPELPTGFVNGLEVPMSL